MQFAYYTYNMHFAQNLYNSHIVYKFNFGFCTWWIPYVCIHGLSLIRHSLPGAKSCWIKKMSDYRIYLSQGYTSVAIKMCQRVDCMYTRQMQYDTGRFQFSLNSGVVIILFSFKARVTVYVWVGVSCSCSICRISSAFRVAVL